MHRSSDLAAKPEPKAATCAKALVKPDACHANRSTMLPAVYSRLRGAIGPRSKLAQARLGIGGLGTKPPAKPVQKRE